MLREKILEFYQFVIFSVVISESGEQCYLIHLTIMRRFFWPSLGPHLFAHIHCLEVSSRCCTYMTRLLACGGTNNRFTTPDHTSVSHSWWFFVGLIRCIFSSRLSLFCFLTHTQTKHDNVWSKCLVLRMPERTTVIRLYCIVNCFSSPSNHCYLE